MRKPYRLIVSAIIILVVLNPILGNRKENNKEEIPQILANELITNNKIGEILNKKIEENQKIKIEEEYSKLEDRRRERIIASRSGIDRGLFAVTCYDLSEESTGKKVGHKYYGITASGVDLTGHTWETARAIAVDPSIIPLGSEVRITFVEEGYEKYNGIYTAVDTGGAIKSKIVDFFLGDFKQNKAHKSVWEFGRTKAKIEILE